MAGKSLTSDSTSGAFRKPLGISLVLPAHNEEDNIVAAIYEAERALSNLVGGRYEILVIDDGSRDSTAACVEEVFRKRPAIRLTRHSRNLGYGAALRTGFLAARFDLVAFTDADCQFFVEDLALLVGELVAHDVVCGYRIQRQDHWLRLAYSGAYNFLVRSLLGTSVRDCDCALKLFRKSVLDGLSIQSEGFLINAEILTRLRQCGASIGEVGVRHRPRLQGRSTVSPLHALPVLVELLCFWWSTCLYPQTEQT